ncbi:hypothetical protein Tco_1203612 [Tanacetum coccineum]
MRFKSEASMSKKRVAPKIFTGHRFSPNKTSAVYEKTSPRSDLRWKPTGRIFKSVGLRWIPLGKSYSTLAQAGKSQSMVAEKADISETIVKVDSQMMIQVWILSKYSRNQSKTEHEKRYDMIKKLKKSKPKPERSCLSLLQSTAAKPQSTKAQLRINNDIYSIVDACLNACEMWKAIERLKQDHNKLLPETKENEIDKLIALITLSFKKIYKPTNKNLRTSSNTSKADQDNTPRINRGTGYDNKRVVKVVGARENVDAADNSGPIFDAEPLQKVQNDDDNYNMFPNDREHPEQLEYVNVTYMKEHDLKKFLAELDRYHDVNYASKVEIDYAKAKGDLMSYKMESQKSFNEYTRKINDLNQMISEMKKELIAHQETISIISQEKEARNKFHKTREDKELEKIIALENKIKVLDDIVYKTGQSL